MLQWCLAERYALLATQILLPLGGQGTGCGTEGTSCFNYPVAQDASEILAWSVAVIGFAREMGNKRRKVGAS